MATTDAFVASMSFAQLQRGGAAGGGGGRMGIGCDCDECGYLIGAKSQIPATIQDAIHRYKRRKLETGSSLKRTQDRSLVKRGNPTLNHNNHGNTTTTTTNQGVAIWQWIMPHGAEPLLEFGNSHRFLWIKRLPGRLYSIGQGIVGSQAEEKMRREMSFQESSLYFYPSNGGKAVGWVHKMTMDASFSTEETSDKESNTRMERPGGPAEILIAKIPADCISTTKKEKTSDDIKDEDNPWSQTLVDLCRKYCDLPQTEEGIIVVSDDDGEVLKKAMLG